MMTRPPAVLVLMLVLACTAESHADAQHPEPSFVDRLALFEHVLFNDDRWSPVLHQQVKLSAIDLPRFVETATNSATVDRIRLVAKDAVDTTALQVLRNLMEKSPWSGTNVNYAASVLSAAFTCFTYNNVSYVLSKVNEINEVAHAEKKLIEKHREIDIMLDDVRMVFMVFMNKVAAVDGDLNVFVDGLYDYDSADEDGSDITQFNVLKLLKDDVDAIVTKQCYPIASTEGHYLSRCNAPSSKPAPESASEPAPESALDEKMVLFNKIVNCMIDVYDRLDVETMPMDTWIRILEYSIPINKRINFYINGTPAVRSPEGTRTERFKKALQLGSEEETAEQKKKKKEEKNKKKKNKTKKTKETKESKKNKSKNK